MNVHTFIKSRCFFSVFFAFQICFFNVVVKIRSTIWHFCHFCHFLLLGPAVCYLRIGSRRGVNYLIGRGYSLIDPFYGNLEKLKRFSASRKMVFWSKPLFVASQASLKRLLWRCLSISGLRFGLNISYFPMRYIHTLSCQHFDDLIGTNQKNKWERK